MERQIFINEMQARFNLRKPRSEKPTNLYLVCRINNKQVKLSTGVKIYPDHWNEKRQEAYISVRLSELDNINNTIVNKKITKLKEYFFSYYISLLLLYLPLCRLYYMRFGENDNCLSYFP